MKVTIDYFKPSGKWYTRDEDVEWPADPTHYDGWKRFGEVVRIPGMIAVCINTPHGFPQMNIPGVERG